VHRRSGSHIVRSRYACPIDGLRAVSKGEIAKPQLVIRYLVGKFGDQLEPARALMRRLAASLSAEELSERAFHRHERVRPEVSADECGWGAKGVLDLAKIDTLVRRVTPR